MSGRASRRRGAEWERQLVSWLRLHGAPHAERAGGGHDQAHGDVVGIPSLYLEARNRARLDLGQWCDEAELAAAGRTWVLAVKRRGVGDTGKSYAVTSLDEYLHLARAAGHLPQEGR